MGEGERVLERASEGTREHARRLSEKERWRIQGERKCEGGGSRRGWKAE